MERRSSIHRNICIRNKMSNKRNLNLDLIRVIASLLVVFLHINLMFLFLYPINSGKGIFVWVAEIFSMICVNLFALISGAVGYKKEFKLSKVWNIWSIALFYNIIATLIQMLQNGFDSHTLIKMFLPITTQRFWYVTSYFALMFLMPILNKGIESLTEKTFYIFCTSVFLLFSIISSVKDVFILNGGSSVLWLMVLYVIGAGIIKFDLIHKIKLKIVSILYFATLIFNYLFFVLMHWHKHLPMPTLAFDLQFLHHNEPFTFANSILFFMLMLMIPIFAKQNNNENNNENIVADNTTSTQRKSLFEKLVVETSPLTLGIYLAHTSLVEGFQLVTKINLIEQVRRLNVFVFALAIILITAVVFLSSALVEKCRIKLFDAIKNLSVKK